MIDMKNKVTSIKLGEVTYTLKDAEAVIDTNYVHTDNNLTNEDVEKINAIDFTATETVQLIDEWYSANPDISGTEDTITTLKFGDKVYKLGSSSGGGTTVVANVTTATTDPILNKLSVDDVIYTLGEELTLNQKLALIDCFKHLAYTTPDADSKIEVLKTALGL